VSSAPAPAHPGGPLMDSLQCIAAQLTPTGEHTMDTMLQVPLLLSAEQRGTNTSLDLHLP